MLCFRFYAQELLLFHWALVYHARYTNNLPFRWIHPNSFFFQLPKQRGPQEVVGVPVFGVLIEALITVVAIN